MNISKKLFACLIAFSSLSQTLAFSLGGSVGVGGSVVPGSGGTELKMGGYNQALNEHDKGYGAKTNKSFNANSKAKRWGGVHVYGDVRAYLNDMFFLALGVLGNFAGGKLYAEGPNFDRQDKKQIAFRYSVPIAGIFGVGATFGMIDAIAGTGVGMARLTRKTDHDNAYTTLFDAVATKKDNHLAWVLYGRLAVNLTKNMPVKIGPFVSVTGNIVSGKKRDISVDSNDHLFMSHTKSDGTKVGVFGNFKDAEHKLKKFAVISFGVNATFKM